MALQGGSFAEYDKRLHALAAVLRNEVDTSRQVLSELREIATSYKAFRRRVKSLQADDSLDSPVDAPRQGYPPRRQPSYGEGGVPRPESLADIQTRYKGALEIAEDLDSYIPTLLRRLRSVKDADANAAQKAQAFAADLKWLDTPLPSRCFRAYTRDCPVHGWARARLMILAVVFGVFTTTLLVAVAFATVYVVWPFLLQCGALAIRLWNWTWGILFLVRALVGDDGVEDYGELK